MNAGASSVLTSNHSAKATPMLRLTTQNGKEIRNFKNDNVKKIAAGKLIGYSVASST